MLSSACTSCPHLLHDPLQTRRPEHLFLRVSCAQLASVSVLPWRVAPQCKRQVPALEVKSNILALQLWRGDFGAAGSHCSTVSSSREPISPEKDEIVVRDEKRVNFLAPPTYSRRVYCGRVHLQNICNGLPSSLSAADHHYSPANTQRHPPAVR